MADNEHEHEQEQDSGVIRDLRQQVKALQRNLKASEAKVADAVAIARAQIQSEQAYAETGLPDSVRDTVLGALGDAPATAEALTEAAEGLGLGGLLRPAESPAPAAPAESAVVESIASVASLGASVAHMAMTGQNDNIMDRIMSAETPDQLAAIMRESGQGT